MDHKLGVSWGICPQETDTRPASRLTSETFLECIHLGLEFFVAPYDSFVDGEFIVPDLGIPAYEQRVNDGVIDRRLKELAVVERFPEDAHIRRRRKRNSWKQLIRY